jgi:8-oxo-dGTP pyrophosphatase MutT (NUDIX family)
MADWHDVPVFGERPIDRVTIIRPSAYGLITDTDGRLAIVHAPSGVCLPGGGSNESERPDETVRREVREECGLIVQLGVWRRAAIEHVFSSAELTQFEKRCIFCDGRAIGLSDNQSEADHTLEWASAADAVERVTSASHRWAIAEWLGPSRRAHGLGGDGE